MQDWELLAKSYDDISDRLINDAKLLRLNLYILALRYLKEGASCFIELPTKDEGEEKNDPAKSQVSNLEKEKNKQKTIRKEKKESRITTRLATFCPFAYKSPKPKSLGSLDSSIFAPPLSGLSALSALCALSALSALSTLSALFAPSAPSTLSALSAPFAPSAPSPPSTPSAPSGSFASILPPPTLSTLSAPFNSSASVPLLSALSAPSAHSTPSALSAFFLPAISWLFLYIPTPGQRRLIEWNRREKRASSSKKIALLPLLPFIEHPLSSVFFPSTCGQKKLLTRHLILTAGHWLGIATQKR